MLEVPESLKAKVEEVVAVLHEHLDDLNMVTAVPPSTIPIASES